MMFAVGGGYCGYYARRQYRRMLPTVPLMQAAAFATSFAAYARR